MTTNIAKTDPDRELRKAATKIIKSDSLKQEDIASYSDAVEVCFKFRIRKVSKEGNEASTKTP